MPNDPQHILIVDDEQDIRNLLRLTLEANGYVCHTAENAKAAIENFLEPIWDSIGNTQIYYLPRP